MMGMSLVFLQPGLLFSVHLPQTDCQGQAFHLGEAGTKKLILANRNPQRLVSLFMANPNFPLFSAINLTDSSFVFSIAPKCKQGN